MPTAWGGRQVEPDEEGAVEHDRRHGAEGHGPGGGDVGPVGDVAGERRGGRDEQRGDRR